MRRRKCYISGKISGLGRGAVENKFSKSVLEVFKRGYVPVSPLNTCVAYWMPWWLHMAVDIITLMNCDAIYLQSDWRQSRGARMEKWVAIVMEKEIIH
jgi:hypothetical protein